jgi:hypothetical protein
MLLVTIGVTTVPAYAETSLNLPAAPILQRFVPPDPNGDTGSTDCMAAAFSTALLTMYDTGNLSGMRESYAYPTIRQFLRSWAPDLQRGITPQVLSAATPTVTHSEFTLTLHHVDPSSWQVFLRRELRAGRPVIVHMADRNALYDPTSQGELSHVIVVYGMDQETVSFTDSWDGVAHSLSHAHFAAAWSQGYYSWIAFPFIPQL